jgi:hypothetical protein
MTSKIFFRISVVALFTAGAVAHATALSFKDISGKWCSEAGDYDFRPDMLIAKFHDRTPSRRLKVQQLRFQGRQNRHVLVLEGPEAVNGIQRIRRRWPHDGAARGRERTAPRISSLLKPDSELSQGLIRRSSS